MNEKGLLPRLMCVEFSKGKVVEMRLFVQLLCDKYNRKHGLFLNNFFTIWPFFRLQRCLFQN